LDRLLSVHITHKTVDIGLLEKIGNQTATEILTTTRGMRAVRESAVLKTCNRVEIYTVTDDREATREELEKYVNGFIPFDSEGSLVQVLTGKESLRHLLRVSSGLESLIIGEDQIQAQVKEAYENGKKEGSVGPVLSLCFQKAINVGKKVRSSTRVNKGCVSVGSAAVELAEQKLGDLKGKKVLIIGAGEMASLIAKHLMGKGPNAVFISNRTYARAVELAWVMHGKAVRFDALNDFLTESDVIICATSASHMILELRHVERAMQCRQGRGMFIIDVSFPRNVADDVRSLPDVELFDIDGLRQVAEDNILRRHDEIKGAERIVLEELDKLDRNLREMEASALLAQLFRRYEAVREREVRKAVARARAGADPFDEVMHDLGAALMARFLADPVERIKHCSAEGCGSFEEVRSLFKLEEEKDVPNTKDAKTEDERGH
jgi:glutamyl-tRNA reductase